MEERYECWETCELMFSTILPGGVVGAGVVVIVVVVVVAKSKKRYSHKDIPVFSLDKKFEGRRVANALKM